MNIWLDKCSPVLRITCSELFAVGIERIHIDGADVVLDGLGNNVVSIDGLPEDAPVMPFLTQLPEKLWKALDARKLNSRTTILLLLFCIDRFFDEKIAFKTHIYTESDDEILTFLSGDRVLCPYSGNDLYSAIDELFSNGLIYRFFVATKFQRIGYGKNQLRLCSWGREYVIDFLLDKHSGNPEIWKTYHRIDKLVTDKLAPYIPYYEEYVDRLYLEQALSEPSMSLREVLPYKVLI